MPHNFDDSGSSRDPAAPDLGRLENSILPQIRPERSEKSCAMRAEPRFPKLQVSVLSAKRTKAAGRQDCSTSHPLLPSWWRPSKLFEQILGTHELPVVVFQTLMPGDVADGTKSGSSDLPRPLRN